VSTKAANPYYQPLLYFLGKHITGLSFNTIWRRRVLGREHIPPRGTAAIFAANHRSLADPNLVGSAIPYPVHFFAKEELFHVPLLGWCIRRVNAFPVKRREHDISAFKAAVRILQEGEGLVLFPEGGRRLDPARQWKVKPGLGLLASKTGAQVVPVCVINSDRFTKLSQVTVIFGAPILPPMESSHQAYQAFSDLVMQKIRNLGGL
jgi:1-acyl-sn-glycerol-3-phosphate acyltransferase